MSARQGEMGNRAHGFSVLLQLFYFISFRVTKCVIRFVSWHDALIAICTCRMSIVDVERHGQRSYQHSNTRISPTIRNAIHKFQFLDDRTIGCKKDETRVHAPVMRMPLLVATNVAGERWRRL